MPRQVYQSLSRQNEVSVEVVYEPNLPPHSNPCRSHPDLDATPLSRGWIALFEPELPKGSVEPLQRLALVNVHTGQEISLHLTPGSLRMMDIIPVWGNDHFTPKDGSGLLFLATPVGEVVYWVCCDEVSKAAQTQQMFVKYAPNLMVHVDLYANVDKLTRALTETFADFPGLHPHYDLDLRRVAELTGRPDLGPVPPSTNNVKIRPIGLDD